MSGFNITTGAAGLPSFNITSATFGIASTAQNGTGFRSNTALASSNKTSSSFTPFKVKQSQDFGPQVNFTIWLLTALSAAFLALRVYCKFLRHRGLWWDDHVLIAAWLSLVISSAFVSLSVTLGFGRPLSQFNFENLDIFLLVCNLAGTFSILSALWSKTSFAITVLRISSGRMKWLVWYIIITVNLSLGVAVAFTWCQCRPFIKVWRPHVPGECWPKYIQIRYNIFTAIYSGAMDIVLALIPWRIIWTLTINKKEKFGVLVAMSMGVFAGITSIIKITQLPSISKSSFTESTTQLVILASAEAAITIMAASIPILRALLRDTRPPPGPAQFYHMDISMYTGTVNSQGTGRSSTVISSCGHRTNGSWSKESDTSGPFRRLSRLSRFSGLSMGFSVPSSNPSQRNTHTGPEVEPPPGKIIQTEEVVVEYEANQPSQPPQMQMVGIGRAV